MIQENQSRDRKQNMLTKFHGIFESYKPRTWQIDEQRQTLTCYDVKDKNNKRQSYNIAHLQVEEGPKSTIFVINLEINKRIYLEASTQIIKNQWIRLITEIKKIIKGQSKKRVTSSFRMNEQKSPKNKSRRNQSSISKKPKAINFSTLIAKQTLTVQQGTLKEVGIYQFTKYLDPTFIQYNIMSGFHRVKSHDLFPVFKERFLILISSKSLYPDKHVTDVMLLQTQLPPWFSLNTLYKFNFKKNKKQQICKIKQILDVSEVAYESNYSVVRINMGKNIHTLAFDSFAMANKWRGLLIVAKINSEEIQQNGRKIKKNIDPIVVEFKQKKLHERLEAFYQTNRPVNSLMSQLMQYLHKTKFQLQSVCEAALAKQPPQNQLISFYFDYFHRKIFIQIKLTWDKRWQTTPPMQMVQIVKWLQDYCSTFIDYISDTQMQQGIITLCKIAGRKVSRQLRPLITSISESDKDQNSFQQNGMLFTHGIIDLFKFVNDSINIYYTPKCSKQLMWMFLVLASSSFKTYIFSLKQTVDNHKLSVNQLIAVTNNAGWFITLISEFIQERVESSGMDQESVKVYLESQQLCRSFMDLSIITRQKLTNPYIDKITKYYRGRKYLSVNLQNILRMVFQYQIPIKYLSSINQKGLWKLVFQTFVNEIIRCICHSYQKSNGDVLKKTIQKIHEQINLLMTQFQQMIGSITQNNQRQKFTKVLIVLTTHEKQSIFDVFKCKEFKDDVYIKKLIEYRTDSPALQKEIMRDLDQQIGEGRMRKSTFIKSGKGRKSTIFQNFGEQLNNRISSQEDDSYDEQSDSQYSNQQVSTVDHTPTTISQGYMQKKKKDKKGFFEQRYFRLKKGVLYWYSNESSSVCQNQINLKQIDGQIIKTQKGETFTLKTNSYGKLSEYKFKCQSFLNRQLWVKSIQIQRKQLLNVKQKSFKPIKVQQKSTLINDYQLMMNPNLVDDEFSDEKRNIHNSTIALKKPRDSGKNSRKVSNNNIAAKQEEKPTGIKGFFYGLFG